MRIGAAMALLVALSSYLAYRVIALEHRVDALGGRLGAPAPDNAGNTGTAGAASQKSQDHAKRIEALEQQALSLREDLQSLEAATADFPDPGAVADPASGEQRILSVIGREQSRIRDRQLQFHRERWLEWRRSALDNFAQAVRLSPAQTDDVQRLLSDEVDALVDILRRPDAAENPERAANDWLDTLEATDRAAERFLTPEQADQWTTARTVERRVFWPWLPHR
jgi:hypothetical protein